MATKKKAAAKPAIKAPAKPGPASVEPQTGTEFEKMELTQQEWDEMDNHATVPHNPPVSIPVYEGTGRNRKHVSDEDYYFRVDGLIYHATESTPHKQAFDMFQAEIKG